MSKEEKRKKVFFASRMMRGLVNGLVMGGVLYVVLDILGRAVNALAGTGILNVTGYALLGLGLGIFAGIGIEICKELTERE